MEKHIVICISCLCFSCLLLAQPKTIDIYHTYDKWVPYFDDGMELYPFRIIFPNGDRAYLSRADVFSPPYYIKIEQLEMPLTLSVRFAHNLIMRKKPWPYRNVPFYFFDTTLTIFPDSLTDEKLFFVKHEQDSVFFLNVEPINKSRKNMKVMKRSRLYLTYNAKNDRTTYRRHVVKYRFMDGREYWPYFWHKHNIPHLRN